MANVWIKTISNDSSYPITFIQDDPLKHPLLKSGTNIYLPDNPDVPSGGFDFDEREIQVEKESRIIVNPRGRLTADWFVIPCSSYGSLEIICNKSPKQNKSTRIIVGKGKFDGDSMLISIPNEMNEIPCGKNGPFRDVELAISIKNDTIDFIFLNFEEIDELYEIRDEVKLKLKKCGKNLHNYLFSH
jgi:hypothetical protein